MTPLSVSVRYTKCDSGWGLGWGVHQATGLKLCDELDALGELRPPPRAVPRALFEDLLDHGLCAEHARGDSLSLALVSKSLSTILGCCASGRT